MLAPHYSRMVLKKSKGGPVRGTLRIALQSSMESLVRETIARLRPWGVRNAALAVVDSRDRSLIALVGSADWSDASIAGEVNAWTARRSPGSTLKPFVYGLALDQGLIHEKTVLIDRPQSFGGWAPENADLCRPKMRSSSRETSRRRISSVSSTPDSTNSFKSRA